MLMLASILIILTGNIPIFYLYERNAYCVLQVPYLKTHRIQHGIWLKLLYGDKSFDLDVLDQQISGVNLLHLVTAVLSHFYAKLTHSNLCIDEWTPVCDLYQSDQMQSVGLYSLMYSLIVENKSAQPMLICRHFNMIEG